MNVKIELVEQIPQIRKVVSRVVKNDNWVDDITQECCLLIMQKENLWDESRGSFQSWINCLSRNVAIKMGGKNRFDSIKNNEYVDSSVVDQDFDTEENLQIKIDNIMELFNELPSRQKEIMTLRYFHGMKGVEISEKLNITPATVSIQIKLALKKLKRQSQYQGLFAFMLPWNWLFDVNSKVLSKYFTLKVVAAVVLSGIFTTQLIRPEVFQADSLVSQRQTMQSQQIASFGLQPTATKKTTDKKELLGHWKLDDANSAKKIFSSDASKRIKFLNKGSALFKGGSARILATQKDGIAELKKQFGSS